MKLMKILLIVSIPFLIWAGCQDNGEDVAESAVAYHPNEQFNEYWYNNEAELAHYKLTQARYGELREGDAVLIFVTEHLDPQHHVKTANEDNSGIPILKLNATRNFTTGIYPYSLMTSVFTPVNIDQNPNSLKVSFTGQEWCGHVFQLLDLRGDSYKAVLHSYFEGEADKELTLKPALLEDEIFNRIRINPLSLPKGELEIIPTLTFLRLKHVEMKPYKAIASFKDEGEFSTYSIEFPELQRSLIIEYQKLFPHKITRWEETYNSGFGDNIQTLTTTAVLDTTIMLDYWNKNAAADTIYRKLLGF